jgi:cyclic pyranopterin monophosphate synthase
MVDVSDKRETVREAVARAMLRMKPATLRVIRQGNAPKGDVLGVARTAGILAAKRTPQLIPLCHPLRITGVDVTFSDDLRRGELTVEARVRTVDKTGVEMEALTAAAVAALTVYDMVKAVERGVTISAGPRKPARVDELRAEPEDHSTMNIAVRSRVASISGHPRNKPASWPPLQ